MSSSLKNLPLSILDLATIVEGDASAGDAFKRSRKVAQEAEKLGFLRYWFAEHHNMESVASAATSVLIGYVAEGTKTIRVGAGGIMLPNHAPLVIAEQFGTLASLYPDRIDLGLGRAPGTDGITSHALRRNLHADVNDFPNDVVELINYLGPRKADARVRAIPGQDTQVPVWLLGSSTFSAQLAAMLGLPFAFASHFAPAHLTDALRIYRSTFKPSVFLDKPYAMLCVNIVLADTDAQAAHLATSFQQLALGLFRNDRRPLPAPVADMNEVWSPAEKAGVEQMLAYSFTGSPETVKKSLGVFVEKNTPDELMVTSHFYRLEDRLHSLRLLKELAK